MGRVAVLAVLVLASAGCSSPTVACTEIGAPSGLNVVVEREAAAGRVALDVKVCWAKTCVDEEVVLAPGSDTVDQGCDPGGPDSACSATAVPNGTLVGFLDIPGMPVGPVTLTGRLVRDGRPSTLAKITVESATTFPNGAQCPPGGNQAAVTVGRDGWR